MSFGFSSNLSPDQLSALGPAKTNTGFYNEKIPKGYKGGKIQQFSPEQIQLFQSLFSQVGPDSYLSKLAGGDEDIFNQIEAPALRQFSGLQGNIASRFSGMGLGGRKNSGFQNTMNAEASNFAQQLQSQRQSLQQNAITDLSNMSNQLLSQRPYENVLQEKKQKQSGWGSAIGTGLGGAAGFFLGGPAGALAGAKLGYGIGSSF